MEESMECDMCHLTGVPLKTCSACKTVKYCSTVCQTAAWVEHRAACQRARKVREKEEAKLEGAKEPGSGITALKQKRFEGRDIFNACGLGRDMELQKMLLQDGIDIDWAEPDTGCTAVHVAANEGHDKCMALLISKSANLMKVDKDGYAPIHMACIHGRYTTLKLLLDNGVDASLPTADNKGNTPGTISCSAGHVKLLALLLDRGSDPNLADKVGNTAVHMASATGQVKCIQLLVKRGANINMSSRNGQTPLDLARIFKHRECEDLLLANDGVGKDVADLLVLDEAHKEKITKIDKSAKAFQKGARKCDNPACQTRPDDKSNKRPKKCAACEVALYCCAACQTAHWPVHSMLCQELR